VRSSTIALTIFVGLIAFAGTPSLPAVTLTEKGQPRAVLITGDQPSPAAKLGALILRDHIRQISGATLPIRSVSTVAGQPTPDCAWVLVGETQPTTIFPGPGGIFLRAKGNILELRGADLRTPTDPAGTHYAVVTFLEEKLGVRWLWPGELGKVVPRQDTIRIEDFQMSYTPQLAQRRIRNSLLNNRLENALHNLGFAPADYKRLRETAERTVSESGDWFTWQKLGGSLGVNSGHAFGHLWAKYGREHPDWFALQPDGTRDQSRNGARARLCKSNTDLIAAIAREKIEELNKNPQLAGVSLSPNDGSVNRFCCCPKCEALDAPNGRKVKIHGTEHVSLTDRMVYFWNAIAELVTRVHPHALFTVDAYSAYGAPPVLRKLHPNLVVRFVQVQYTEETRRQQGLHDWDEWAKAARKIYYRPNLMLAGRRSGAPLIYVHKFAEDFRYLAHHSMWGTDFDSCTHNWATQGLNYYVVARLHWNPDQNVDAIIDDYCRTGFGGAAKTVRRYFDILEAITNELASKRTALDADSDTPKIEPLPVFTPQALAELRNLLRQAQREANGDPLTLQRLAFLERGLRWTETEVRLHSFLRDPNPDTPAARQACEERHALMRDLFQNDFLAVNVAAISWAEDGFLKRLGWKPPPR